MEQYKTFYNKFVIRIRVGKRVFIPVNYVVSGMSRLWFTIYSFISHSGIYQESRVRHAPKSGTPNSGFPVYWSVNYCDVGNPGNPAGFETRLLSILFSRRFSKCSGLPMYVMTFEHVQAPPRTRRAALHFLGLLQSFQTRSRIVFRRKNEAGAMRGAIECFLDHIKISTPVWVGVTFRVRVCYCWGEDQERGPCMNWPDRY